MSLDDYMSLIADAFQVEKRLIGALMASSYGEEDELPEELVQGLKTTSVTVFAVGFSLAMLSDKDEEIAAAAKDYLERARDKYREILDD